MVLLSQNRAWSVDNICTELGMSKRTIYRYIDSFRELGFVLIKEGTRYRLDHTSPYFSELTTRTRLTDEDAATIFRVLSATHNTSPEVRQLVYKMNQLYDRDAVMGQKGAMPHIHNIVVLFDAMRLERVVMLQRYVDPETGTLRDIIVEPYHLSADERVLYAFDIKAGENRTFRIDHVRNIEMLDLLWVNQSKHRMLESDVFGQMGRAELPLRLVMTTGAAIDLLRLYPNAEDFIRPAATGKGERISVKVCDYEAPARFVMSHIDEVQIVNSPDFEAFVREKVQHVARKFAEPNTEG